ncbi:hypothetical protein IWX65_002718 [Arthrobacter sp. CAN_A214]|uniref:hypothetical protein n=1 Tax=Arthrobacter sp. CAN_A214 TaxID=2787720 RepID=UPI0018CA67FF
MRRAQRTPELFSIVPGDPWTINGEPTEARTPQDAIDRVFSLATRFPAQLNVHQGEQVIALEMDRRGRTRPIPTAPDATPEAQDQQTAQEEPTALPAAPAAPVTPPAVITPVEPTVAPSTPADPAAHTEETDRPRRLITPMRLAGAVALVAILGIGGTLTQGSGDEQGPDAAAQEPTETPDGWTMPEGQDVMGIIGDRIITAESTTVRLLDAETGEEAWSMADVDNTAQARSIDGTTASAMDTGAGQVAVLRDGEVSVVRGALNARGTEPVITNEREYTGPDGTTGSLEDAQAVLAATAEGVVLLESPNKIVTEGTTVELATPEAEATITQAIRATDDRAVMVWSRGDTRWLTTHELTSGDVQLQQDIGAAEVTVRSGIVWIGSDQTLTGDEIRPVCDGGEQVTATIICPGPDGWESADGVQQYPKRPDAISPSYTVTAGTVTAQRKDR